MMDTTAAVPAGVAAGVTAVTVQTALIILGIPAAVLLAAFAGALFGLAYTAPDAWGRLLDIPAGTSATRLGWFLLRAGGLCVTLCAIALASAWSVSVLPYFPLLTFLRDVPEVPMAGITAFAGQRLIPHALSAGERWLDRRSEK